MCLCAGISDLCGFHFLCCWGWLLSRRRVRAIALTAIFTVALLKVVSLELFTQVTVWPRSCVDTYPCAVMRGPTRILSSESVGKASLKKHLGEVQAQRSSQLVLRKFYLCESRFIQKMHFSREIPHTTKDSPEDFFFK